MVTLEKLTEKALSKEALCFDEVHPFTQWQKWSQVLALAAAACQVREKFVGTDIDLCSLVNAKSGLCPEDCAFCAQSSFYDTGCATYPLIAPEEMVEAARRSEVMGADRFCVVTSGEKVTKEELRRITEALKEINHSTALGLDCSLGCLDAGSLDALKEAGVTRYNHNLEAAPSYFSRIVNTHKYEDRVNTVRLLKAAGIETCCGGIIGMGETPEQRLELAFALGELDVDCVPINILNPRPGTPLADIPCLSPMEIIKTIALFRLLLPDKTIKLAGGREANLRDLQALGLLAGANGLIIGGYLTTSSRSPNDDLQMLKDLGYAVGPGQIREASKTLQALGVSSEH